VPNEPSPSLVRIYLRYPDEESFITRFAANVTRGGVFLASRKPRPVGDIIRFEISLAQGPPLLYGLGKVTWVREFNPAEPHRAHGMGVQFTGLDPKCQDLLERLLERKSTSRPTAVNGVPVVRPSGSADRTQANPVGEDDSTEWSTPDDTALRRAVDRARILAGGDDVESLLQPSPEESVTLERALADLPRMLRRSTMSINVADDGSKNS
jgi:molecular chaperone DnaK